MGTTWQLGTQSKQGGSLFWARNRYGGTYDLPTKKVAVYILLWSLQDVVGGHFDAGQAFVGELSQVNIWDRVLKPSEIQSVANCSTYIPGNVVSWLASNVEVFGRGAFKRPLEMCQDRLTNA